LVGLLRNTPSAPSRFYVHQARCRRWGDRTHHEDRVLLDRDDDVSLVVVELA